MRRRRNQWGGSTLIEFTLVGIPLVFVLVSVFELSRGMWTYHTLAAAVKRGTRYSVVHGQDCNQVGNACTVTIAQIAGVIQSAGPGLLPDQFTLTFTPSTGTPVTCVVGTGLLPADCRSNTTTWPPAGANGVGQDVKIAGTYPFRSMISMFWAGDGIVPVFGAVNFSASSTERIQY